MDKNINLKEDECLEQLQRLQAEFENYRKRVDCEKHDILENANEKLIVSLLDILDTFELALKHSDDEGVKMIYSQLYSLLEKNGLKLIEAKGKFNPEIHEVLVQEEGEGDNIILEELQRGYFLNGKVVRPSMVKISKVGKQDG